METCGTLLVMDKAEHGRRLKAAMQQQGHDREDVAAWVGVGTRTITNWTGGNTWPDQRQRGILRQMLGPYDAEGDAVETAVRSSELVEWRQDAVLSVYKRNLYEQREGAAG